MIAKNVRLLAVASLFLASVSSLSAAEPPTAEDSYQAREEVVRVPGGRKPRYELGVRCQPTSRGLRVTHVVRNSPAWDLGLEVGDYITRVNGQRVGIVDGLVYPLANELQRSDGTVDLESWERKTRQYQTDTVELWRR
jgi:C-terminal processing protease CtpA/Prc